MNQPEYERFELFGYWSAISGQEERPLKSRFDPTEVPQILQALSLVVCAEDLADYRISVWGSRLIDLFGEERTGKTFGELQLIENWEETFADYIRIKETGEPILLTGRTVSSDRQHVEYERLSLPLWGNETAEDALTVTHVISQFRVLDRKRVPIS